MIFDEAFLQHLTEFSPEFLIVVFIRRNLLQHIEDATRQCATHRGKRWILLQEFARYVQRQVGRINDAFDEAQIQGQELLRIVHDKDALYVELQASWRFAVPKIERSRRRNIKKARVLALSLYPVMTPG